MYAIRRMLLPTALARPPHRAADVAGCLATRFGAELHVVHAFMPMFVSELFEGMPVPPPKCDDDESGLRAIMARFVRESLSSRCNRVVPHLVRGAVVPVIASVVQEHGVDLVIVGCHRHGALRRFLCGSTSRAIWRSLPCAVLMVPDVADGEHRARGHATIRRRGGGSGACFRLFRAGVPA